MTTPVEAAAQAYLADRKINGAAPKTLAKFRPFLALLVRGLLAMLLTDIFRERADGRVFEHLDHRQLFVQRRLHFGVDLDHQQRQVAPQKSDGANGRASGHLERM